MKHYIYAPVLCFLLACGRQQTAEKKETAQHEAENLVQLSDAQLKNAGITTTRAEKRNIATALKVSGRIDVPPQNIVSVSFPLGGYLKSTRLLPGMHVNRGTVIGVLEDQQYIQLEQDYLTAKARLAFLEKEYERQQVLNRSKASSDKLFQQTAADYKSQQILLRALAEKLELIGVDPARLNENSISRSVNIYSPINGFVTKVNVNIGKYVNPTDVLFEIVNPEDIHLALTVFEKDVSKLAVGQRVIAYTNNDTAKRYECEVILIGQDIASDRGVEVHCHFESYDKSLIPGTFMNALIETAADSVLALPEEAVVRYQNQQYAFVRKDNNIFEILSLKTGARENGYIQVAAADGSDLARLEFVTKGAYSLLMKLKNTVEEE
jgi:cobalt-zinc-cadmium efflux system membrane fusion protein